MRLGIFLSQFLGLKLNCMNKLLLFKLTTVLCFGLIANTNYSQLFPNGDFELGPAPSNCQCATSFTCGNDAGRVIDGFHPVYVPGNQGCIGVQNYAPALGAYSGTSSIYFYAGADNINATPVNFVGGEDVCLTIYYCGPQGAGASGQNTANSHFSFKLDGAQIGPDVLVPVNTGWTQHSMTVTMTPGAHTFGILSGGAAQYAIWFDDFSAVICGAPTCDPSWTTTTLCSTDPPIDLNTLITGDTGGTWSGTGITGSMFDPSVGTQSITYTNAAPCTDFSTQTITVNTTATATWNLPPATCSNAPLINLNSLITGTAGGTWSGIGVTGNNFDPASGSQNVTYTVGTAPCNASSAQTITITPSADATWTNPGTICQSSGVIDLTTLITGTTGGTWSGTGVTGTNFDPAGLSGPITITYDVGTAPCADQLAQDINVVVNPSPAWTPPANMCDSDPPVDLTTTITGTTGGTWSGTGITGTTFDPSGGTQNITYTVGSGACQQVLSQNIIVGTGGNPAWNTLTMCLHDVPLDLTAQITGDVGGTWSGTSMTGSTFDPSSGTQTITYSVGAGGCLVDMTQDIVVYDPSLALTATNIACFGDVNGIADVTVTGGSGNYSYAWDNGGNTAQITGLAAGTYTLTVTDLDGGCTVTGSIDIIEPAAITASLTASYACAPSLGSATATATGGTPGYSYLWTSSAETTATATNLDSAMQIVNITDINGCTYIDSIQVNVYPQATAIARTDTTIVRGDCVRLNVSSGVAYSWLPDYELTCADCKDPIACPTVPTDYCVSAIDSNGCADSACVKIGIEIICGDVFVPSAFSPNNDNENDLECVYSDCMESMVFTIYNRWGEVVFETSDMNICWDGTWKGKELNTAVFVYRLEGFLINGEQVSQKGNISLIR